MASYLHDRSFCCNYDDKCFFGACLVGDLEECGMLNSAQLMSFLIDRYHNITFLFWNITEEPTYREVT